MQITMEADTSSTKSVDEHVTKSNKKSGKPICQRFITTLIFFASLTMCAKETTDLVFTYLTNPVNTQIIMTVNDVMTFPAITVCNLNPVRRFKWKEKNVDVSKNSTKANTRKKRKTRMETLSGDNTDGDTRSKRQVLSDQYYVNALEEFATGNRDKLDNVEESLDRLSSEELVYESKNWKDTTNSDLAEINEILQDCDKVLNAVGAKILKIENNMTSYMTYFTSMEKAIEEANEEAMKAVEETMKAMEEAREKAKELYLSSLRANFTEQPNIQTENVTTSGIGNETKIKKLPPSKDLQAFNNYLEEIGEMKRDEIADLGHQKEDFIALCSWRGAVCEPRHFDVFQDFIYGNCFTFNTSHVGADVKDTGPRSGLALSLYVEQNEYIDRVAPAAGARVVIHEHDQQPFPEDEGFSVAAGHTTTVLMNKFSTTTVAPMCDPNIEISHRNNNNDTSFTYSQKACVRQCLSKAILQECNCSGRQFLLDRNDSCLLKNPEQESCVQRLESLSRKNMLPNCSCPARCGKTRYEPIISSASWPAEKYLPLLTEELVRVDHESIRVLNNNTDLDITEFFRKNFLRINIFFDKLVEQEMVNSYAYTLESLLSDIGGQLGLWVGVSVATVHESLGNVFAFANFIYTYIRKKIRRRKICTFDKKADPSETRRSYQVTSSNIAFDVKGTGASYLQASQNTLSTMSPYVGESMNSLAPWHGWLGETDSESIYAVSSATSAHASKNSPFPRKQNMWSVDSHTSARLSSGTPTFGSSNQLRVDSLVDDTIVYDIPRVTRDADTHEQNAIEATSSQQSRGAAVTRINSKISNNSPKPEPSKTPNKNKKPKSKDSKPRRNHTPMKLKQRKLNKK